MPELEPSTIAAAIGVFITTCYLTWKGWRDERKKIAQEKTQVVAGLIQDNVSLHRNTDALEDNTRALNSHTAALHRLSDLMILTGKRK